MNPNAPEAESRQVTPKFPALAILIPLLACSSIYLLGLVIPRIIGEASFWVFLPGFFTETIFLICSLTLSAWLTKGHMATFGFTKGSFHLTPRLFLWLLPMLVIATLQVLGSAAAGSANHASSESIGSPVGIILTIWIYASICEEIFTRGLLQSWLAARTQHRFHLGTWNISVPVVVSALFFATMHLVLWRKLGLVTLIVLLLTFFLGVIAGHYREKTGSLIPAILIHSFFDIGGTLPAWIAVWWHHGHI